MTYRAVTGLHINDKNVLVLTKPVLLVSEGVDKAAATVFIQLFHNRVALVGGSGGDKNFSRADISGKDHMDGQILVAAKKKRHKRTSSTKLDPPATVPVLDQSPCPQPT